MRPLEKEKKSKPVIGVGSYLTSDFRLPTSDFRLFDIVDRMQSTFGRMSTRA